MATPSMPPRKLLYGAFDEGKLVEMSNQFAIG